MCSESELEKWVRDGLTRRQLGALGAAAGIAACAPTKSETGAGSANALAERAVTFDTAAGTMDGEFFHPADGKHPGVIFWPDIAGIRPAKRQMARRLAEAGYAVLLANPYYRDVAGQQFEDFVSFAGGGGFQKVGPWRGKFTVETIQTDASACATWLGQQDAVDNARGIGAQGYCMTGSFAVVAASSDDRIRAGASFHGGQLVRAEGPSPHTMLRKEANYLIAIAQNDDGKAPDEKTALRTAAAEARAKAEIDVYPADHGWCVLDSSAYSEAAAEHAWSRLLAMYKRAL